MQVARSTWCPCRICSGTAAWPCGPTRPPRRSATCGETRTSPAWWRRATSSRTSAAVQLRGRAELIDDLQSSRRAGELLFARHGSGPLTEEARSAVAALAPHRVVVVVHPDRVVSWDHRKLGGITPDDSRSLNRRPPRAAQAGRQVGQVGVGATGQRSRHPRDPAGSTSVPGDPLGDHVGHLVAGFGRGAQIMVSGHQLEALVGAAQLVVDGVGVAQEAALVAGGLHHQSRLR